MTDSQIRAQLVKKGALAPTSVPCARLSDAQRKASMLRAIAARQKSLGKVI